MGFNQYYRRKQITRGRYNTTHFLAHTPAGAESDLNATAAAPSQTEVTDLNCSEYSTTSKKWRAASFVESPSDTHSRSDSTIHYGVTGLLQLSKSDSAPAGVRMRKCLVLYLPHVICFFLIYISKVVSLYICIFAIRSKTAGPIGTKLFFFSLIHLLVQSRT